MAQMPSQPSPAETLAELERRLKETPRAARPLEHATLRYNIGMAYAELPSGDRQHNLSRAVSSYQQAAALFGPHRYPVEHARVQNALGAALRELGKHREAADACGRAVRLLSGQQAPGELAAALNNLGLARSDLGEHDEAIQALEQAVEIFAAASEPRQRVTALHNLGQARAAAGDHAAAAKLYEEAIADADPETMPHQWALLQHALGVSLTAVGESHRAVEAFANSLRVFTRQRYPFQYALAKNNLGLACAQIGDVTALRRALGAYEDALRVLDVRVHRVQWEQAYRNLQLAEDALRDAGQEATRTEHFAALVGEVDDELRLQLMRERLGELLELPEPRRSEALTELDLALLRLGVETARKGTAAWLDVLMELPNEMLLAGLRARLAAHEHLDSEEARQEANEALDHAIQHELLAPQRIRVRDTLRFMGWERP